MSKYIVAIGESNFVWFLKNKFFPYAFMVTVILAVLMIFSHMFIIGGAEEFPSSSVETITVQKGETLWSIADSQGFESMDTREVVDYIKEINNIESAAIHAGQSLKVPVDK
jgi:LysM domain